MDHNGTPNPSIGCAIGDLPGLSTSSCSDTTHKQILASFGITVNIGILEAYDQNLACTGAGAPQPPAAPRRDLLGPVVRHSFRAASTSSAPAPGLPMVLPAARDRARHSRFLRDDREFLVHGVEIGESQPRVLVEHPRQRNGEHEVKTTKVGQ